MTASLRGVAVPRLSGTSIFLQFAAQYGILDSVSRHDKMFGYDRVCVSGLRFKFLQKVFFDHAGSEYST